MNKFFSVLFSCVLFVSLSGVAQKSITLSGVLKGEFGAKGVPAFSSMKDGEHYTAMSDDKSKIIKYSYRTGQPVETIFDAKDARECPFEKFEGYEFSDDEKRILIYTDSERIYRRTFRANYYVFDRNRNYIYNVSEGGKQQAAKMSPDGRMVAFARGNNLHLFKLDFGTESQMTYDGEFGKIINGTPDWLYEEEFAVSSSFVWAPDNSCVAFIRTDESEVPMFGFQRFGGLNPTFNEYRTYPGLDQFKYPKAGMPNPKVTVHTYDVGSKKISKMNVPLDNDGYIPRIRFTESPDQLVVMTLNRIQNVFNMYYVNPRSGVSKLILRDESEYYIDDNNFDEITFYKDFIVMVSEKDGFRHLYQHGRSGAMMKQLTIGHWDVTKYLGYDELTKTFYYQSSEGGSTQRNVFSIDARGRKTKLTDKSGVNTFAFSEKFKYYVHSHSNMATPPSVVLKDGKNSVVRILESNKVLVEKLKEYVPSKKEPLFVPLAGEEDLSGWMIKPSNFQAGKKYPVIMTQYSGPGSQSAMDSWAFGLDNYMAEQGFIVVCVDGRGTAARGEKFKKCNYMALGGYETDDQIAVARYLAQQHFVDGKNIGIWGWSYGGYNVLMALSKGNGVFKAGTAVAPVTDWRFYDSAYTERYMRTPQENFDGYNNASPIMWADKLQGHLLLMHGTADDNVHAQNSYEYAEALVQAGKQFDMHIFTNRDHGISGGNTRSFLYTKMINFFKTHLQNN